ncbi:MAG: anthranilate phosphoribosyltransferase [Planctomycetes bacterium]|nr:anthranilate phosphoribosyltransferase [Planctomycetota bacterium]
MAANDTLGRLIGRQTLGRGEARALFDAIMDGQIDAPLLAGILAALATRGEVLDEIVGAAEAMRARVTAVRLPAGVNAIDTCGTGGDGKPTFNISSTVAIVAAAAGATVAKHGNRSYARPSGSAEGLMALGIDVEAAVPTVERCLEECGVAFLYALRLHPAMKHAAPVRTALGVRTIFNLVGPLTNPAGVRRHLLGVNRPEMVLTMAEALRALGAERAMVVHGLEGLCDLSISGPSHVVRWDGERIVEETIDIRVVGSEPLPLEGVFVGSSRESAAVIERVLAGDGGPAREIVVFNAAAALWVAGIVDEWRAGAEFARETIDSGRARALLECWRRVSAADK